jgi:hypothetical protein
MLMILMLLLQWGDALVQNFLMAHQPLLLLLLWRKLAQWFSPKPQVEWFVVMAACALDMARATQKLRNAIASKASSERCVSDNIAPGSSRLEQSAAAMAFARWAIASVHQAMAWHHSGYSENHCHKCAWTRCAQWVVVCMESASRVSVFANKVGKVPTARIHSVRMIALAMANVPSSRCIAQASVFATMAGVAPVVSGWLSMRR